MTLGDIGCLLVGFAAVLAVLGGVLMLAVGLASAGSPAT